MFFGHLCLPAQRAFITDFIESSNRSERHYILETLAVELLIHLRMILDESVTQAGIAMISITTFFGV